jgi:hypothetical protein
LRKGDFLTEEQVLGLCNKAKEILIEESNVQRLDTPITVRTPSWEGFITINILFCF